MVHVHHGPKKCFIISFLLISFYYIFNDGFFSVNDGVFMSHIETQR